jgi:hypothetical protein
MGVKAGLAKTSMNVLNGVLILYSLYQQDAARDAKKAADAMGDLSRASDEELQAKLAQYIAARTFNDQSMDSIAILKDIARESYGTAERIVELGIAHDKLKISTEDANKVLEDEAGAQRQARDDGDRLNAVLNEGADATDGATEKVKELSSAFETLLGTFETQVAFDRLDEQFANLQEAAGKAFGGAVEDVRAYNEENLQTLEQIQRIAELLNLPASVQTRIAFLYDQGQIDKVIGLLKFFDPKRVQDAFKLLPPNTSFFPGMATGGTVTTSGMALVGERGPELLSLPRGAQVTPLTGTNSGGGGNTTVNVSVTSANPDEVVAAIQKWVRQNGALALTTTSAIRF